LMEKESTIALADFPKKCHPATDLTKQFANRD